MKGLISTTQSLSYYRRSQEVAAHNLTQINTDGFKALRLAAHVPAGADNPAPAQWTDWSQGLLNETGRSLDISLEGPGFLVVQTEGGERLTRGGSFRLDPVGRLTDQSGHPLLGKEGPIHLSGVEAVEIHPNGLVLADGAAVAHLRLETVEALSALEREGDGLFRTDETSFDVPQGVTSVRQGVLEQANVEAILSLTDMVSIQRAYAANAQALKTIDRVFEIAATQVGDA